MHVLDGPDLALVRLATLDPRLSLHSPLVLVSFWSAPAHMTSLPILSLYTPGLDHSAFCLRLSD